jgi:hypothetical protein
MSLRKLIEWLEANAGPEDVIPGAAFVEGRGRFNSDWDVTDTSALEHFIATQV